MLALVDRITIAAPSTLTEKGGLKGEIVCPVVGVKSELGGPIDGVSAKHEVSEYVPLFSDSQYESTSKIYTSAHFTCCLRSRWQLFLYVLSDSCAKLHQFSVFFLLLLSAQILSGRHLPTVSYANSSEGFSGLSFVLKPGWSSPNVKAVSLLRTSALWLSDPVLPMFSTDLCPCTSIALPCLSR